MSQTHTDHARRMQTGMKMYLFPRYRKFRYTTVELANISPDNTILDFGCGVGLLEDFIVPKISGSGKIIGVDIGKELIALAQERHATERNCKFRCIDSTGVLPFESEEFDVVITSLVFHLLDRSQKEIVLKEMMRILKPGGRLVLAEIGRPTGLFGRWIKFLTLHYWVKKWPYEINSIDSFADRLPQLIREAQFKNVKIVSRMRGYIDFITCSK